MQESAPFPSTRLTLACGLALFTSGVTLITLGAALVDLKLALILRNLELGWIGGAAFAGFAVGHLAMVPLLSRVPLGKLLLMAAGGHLVGTLTLGMGDSMSPLIAGALLLGAANGVVEAGCNLYVVRWHPDARLSGLVRFHAWFPLGIVFGGVSVGILSSVIPAANVLLLAVGLVAVPALVYMCLLLFTGRSDYALPPSPEVGEQGVGLILRSHLFWLLLVLMVAATILEFGIWRWVPPVINAADLPGTEIVAGAAGLALFVRLVGARWITPSRTPALLLIGAFFAGGSLYGLSEADSVLQLALFTCTFAAGTALFWPTLLGLAAEHFPRYQPAAMGMLASSGMLAVGLIAVPLMGQVIDAQTYNRLPEGRTLAVMNMAGAVLPEYLADTPLRADFQGDPDHIYAALAGIDAVLGQHSSTQSLPPYTTTLALRAIIRTDVPIGIDEEAKAVLGQAEAAASRRALRSLLPASGVLIILLGLMLILQRRKTSL